MPKLTKRVIDGARPKATRFDLWDDALPGFGVRVFPSGTKSFFLYYRDVNRRANRLTLGQFGVLTVDEARQLARSKLLQAKTGDDPAAKRRRQRAAPTIAELVDLYRAERIPRMKASTQRSEEDLLRAHVLKRFGPRSVFAIDKRHLEALRVEMKATPGAFNKVVGLLSRLFSFAGEIGACDRGTNPTKGVKKNPERKLERFLIPEERARLESALARAERTPLRRRGNVSAAACGVFRLLAATGMRLGEVLDLKWRHVDLEHRRLVLPTSKTGHKYVALSGYAIEIIEAQAESGAGAYVFATEAGGRLGQMQRRWAAIRADAELGDLRIHDLRHAWASDAVMAGVPLHLVGRQLGHRSPTTTNRYAHFADNVFADAVERVGEVIETRKAAGAKTNVVTIERGGRGRRK